jgi:hypothetical protein
MRAPEAVKIEVDDRLPRANITAFEDFQGDLKTLRKPQFDKLRSSILTQGFFAPVFVWRQPGNGSHLKLLDGHQRLRVLRGLEADGMQIPPIPYVPIEATDIKDAKAKLLRLTSQYGELDRDGLYAFLVEADLDPVALETDFNLAGTSLDAAKFLDEFINDTSLPEADVEAGRSASNGVVKLQLSFTEDRYVVVMQNIERLKALLGVDNSSDAIDQALQQLCDKQG